MTAIARIQTTPALRQRIERAVERLLALLDEIDGDPELEPSLGWCGFGTGARPREPFDDLEEQCEDEGMPDNEDCEAAGA